MYARGMSVREIVGHLRDLYGVDVSPDFVIGRGDGRRPGRSRRLARPPPLEPIYPLVFFDALRIKIRDEGLVRNKAVYVALGVRADGNSKVRFSAYGSSRTEGGKFWLRAHEMS